MLLIKLKRGCLNFSLFLNVVCCVKLYRALTVLFSNYPIAIKFWQSFLKAVKLVCDFTSSYLSVLWSNSVRLVGPKSFGLSKWIVLQSFADSARKEQWMSLWLFLSLCLKTWKLLSDEFIYFVLEVFCGLPVWFCISLSLIFF